MVEGLDHLDPAQHLVGESSQLPPGLGLLAEHGKGFLGDEIRHHEREGAQDHHDEGDPGVDAEHEQDRAPNGGNAGKELCKAQQKPVGELVDVRDDPADQVPCGVPVHVGQRQLLQTVECLDPQIPDDAVGDLVVDVVHDPLGGRCDSNGDRNGGNDCQESCEVHLPLPHDGVHAPARQDGHVERQRHGQNRQEEGQRHQAAVGTDIAEDAFDRPPVSAPAARCLLTHVPPPPFPRAGRNRSPDKYDWSPAVPGGCRSPPAARRPAPECDPRCGWRTPAGR